MRIADGLLSALRPDVEAERQAVHLQALSEEMKIGDHVTAVIRNNAAREAWGYRAKAAEFKQQKTLLEEQAETDKTASPIKMGSSLLSGMTSAARAAGAGGE